MICKKCDVSELACHCLEWSKEMKAALSAMPKRLMVNKIEARPPHDHANH